MFRGNHAARRIEALEEHHLSLEDDRRQPTASEASYSVFLINNAVDHGDPVYFNGLT